MCDFRVCVRMRVQKSVFSAVLYQPNLITISVRHILFHDHKIKIPFPPLLPMGFPFSSLPFAQPYILMPVTFRLPFMHPSNTPNLPYRDLHSHILTREFHLRWRHGCGDSQPCSGGVCRGSNARRPGRQIRNRGKEADEEGRVS